MANAKDINAQPYQAKPVRLIDYLAPIISKIGDSFGGDPDILATALGTGGQPFGGRKRKPADAGTKVIPEISPLIRAPQIADVPVVSGGVVAPVVAPKIGTLPDIPLQAVPDVTAPTTQSVEELRAIAASGAPSVEAAPLSIRDLVGDVTGLEVGDVMGLIDKQLLTLSTKATTDKQALDFLGISSGKKAAEQLVKEKIATDSAIGLAKFTAESAAAEGIRSDNVRREIANRKEKAATLRVMLENRLTAQAAANDPLKLAEIAKAQVQLEKARVLLALPKLALTGDITMDHVSDAAERLEADALMAASTGQSALSEAEHNRLKQILTIGQQMLGAK